MKKRNVISLFALVLGASLTACSMQFEAITNQYANQIKEDVVNIIEVELSEDLAEIVDNADFKSEEGLQQLADNIESWAEELVSEDTNNLQEFQKATLVRVVDGDTIVVEIENEEYKVRLIGVNTPESVASEEYLEKTGKENTQEGLDASTYLKDLLSEYSEVYLQRDVSETDRYGRLLRYVWLDMPTDKTNVEEISTKMLNGILVDAKIAEPAVYEPDTMYAEEFDELYNR